MSKLSQNAGLDRIARLLDLVPFVATHQGIAIGELAAEFSISESQLTEDLTTLWMCGLPGYTALELMDLSFDTGFVSISNAETLARPRILNRDEVLALVLGLETLTEEIDLEQKELSGTIKELIAKLSKSLDSRIERQVQAGTQVSSNVRNILEKAIANRTVVEIFYHSISRDELSRRRIHPLELSFSEENEYVLAFCESSNGYRTFRMDRISDATASSSSARTPSGNISPTETEKFPLSIEISSRLRDVSERFNLKKAPNDATSENRLDVESFSSDWAIREIMSFGGEVRLESPQSLQDSLRERSLRALSAYRP